jgi:hypothetical protein
MVLILLTQDSRLHRDAPINTKAFIGYRDATVCFGRIEIIALVLEYGCFTQYGKTVSEASGHKELTMILFGEFHSYVLTVSGTPLAYVYRNIEYRTLYATHQLALSERRTLEMQTAHYTV